MGRGVVGFESSLGLHKISVVEDFWFLGVQKIQAHDFNSTSEGLREQHYQFSFPLRTKYDT